MKYPCELAKDLLPLYVDGVCSPTSSKIVEEHLDECPKCKALLNELKQGEIKAEKNSDDLKISSFKNIKKKLFHRQLVFAALAIVLVLSLFLIGVNILKNQYETVKVNNNITVNMIDGSLVVRLRSSRISEAGSKRVTVLKEGKEVNYLFFYLKNNKWDELTTNDEVFSEYVLCPKDKGADAIDAIYYYSGSYEKLEDLSIEQLTALLSAAEKLYEKQ